MDAAYKNWIQDLKQKIRAAQIKASVAVNSEMVLLYWDIGKSIVEKQLEYGWGGKVVEKMAKDLKNELPDTNGFSRTNLFAMRKFYLFYKDFIFVQQVDGQIQSTDNQHDIIVQQDAGQLNDSNILYKIPWQHHVAIPGKCKTTKTPSVQQFNNLKTNLF